MDITQVRRRFQKKWNFSVLTLPRVDLSTAYYSLQQESLNSDDMLLYITSVVRPNLEGSLIESQGQKWIVYLGMKEVVNQNLYEFRLYPVTDQITMTQKTTTTNAIGTTIVSGSGTPVTLDCYVEEYSLKERTVPTAQPVESYQQSFLVAANQLPDYRGIYELTYRGLRFKIDSFERLIGLVKIRATEDL